MIWVHSWISDKMAYCCPLVGAARPIAPIVSFIGKQKVTGSSMEPIRIVLCQQVPLCWILVVVLGSSRVDRGAGDTETGSIRIYMWDETIAAWSQLGQTLTSPIRYGSALFYAKFASLRNDDTADYLLAACHCVWTDLCSCMPLIDIRKNGFRDARRLNIQVVVKTTAFSFPFQKGVAYCCCEALMSTLTKWPPTRGYSRPS